MTALRPRANITHGQPLKIISMPMNRPMTQRGLGQLAIEDNVQKRSNAAVEQHRNPSSPAREYFRANRWSWRSIRKLILCDLASLPPLATTSPEPLAQPSSCNARYGSA